MTGCPKWHADGKAWPKMRRPRRRLATGSVYVRCVCGAISRVRLERVEEYQRRGWVLLMAPAEIERVLRAAG